MLEMLSAILFLLVACGTAWAGFRAGAWRARSLHRLAPMRAPAARPLPTPTLRWRELVSRNGSAAPAAARQLPPPQPRLLRAWVRNPDPPPPVQRFPRRTTL